MGKKSLEYRTFDELMGEVSTDFITYSTEGMIQPGQLVKVAQRVNYDLGLKIHGTKEKLLEICNRNVKLPEDFYHLNFAFRCCQYRTVTETPSGRHTENVIIDSPCNRCGQTDAECECEKTYTVECQNGERIFVQVVEKRKYDVRVYEQFERINFPSSGCLAPGCDRNGNTGYVRQGFLYTNMSSGNVFINYEGMLEDSDGNLLVLDHPMINEYYEYALKSRILENLFIAGEEVTTKMQLIEQRLKTARSAALGIVNMPDFAEMYQTWQMNRKAMQHLYYDPFKS